MNGSRTQLGTLLLAASAVAGCRFEAPSYEGTSYTCGPPRERCPPGFTCVDGRCVDGVDAAVATTTVRVEVAYDTSIRADAPTTNDGPLAFLEVDADPRRVSLVFFDLTSIVLDAQVFGVELHGVAFDPIETGSFQLFPLTEAWTEDGATYDERIPGVPWTPMGMGVPSLDATMLLGEAAPRTPGPVMFTLDAAQVQGWITTPSTNLGFAVVSSSPDGRGGQLRSSEYMVADERPYMLVTLASP